MGENQPESRPYTLSHFFEKKHPIGGSVLVFFGEDELLDRIQLLEWADLVLYFQDRGIEGRALTNAKAHIKKALQNAELAGCVLPFEVDEVMRLEQHGVPWSTESPQV